MIIGQNKQFGIELCQDNDTFYLVLIPNDNKPQFNKLENNLESKYYKSAKSAIKAATRYIHNTK